MRKTFKLLAAALSLVLCAGLQSCHNTEDIPKRYPILFRCADITRAEATITDLQKNGFKVFAHFAVDGNASNFEKEVSYDNGSSVWGYENIEYWIPGATYNFKAFYPKDGYTLEVDNTKATQEYTISDFDITTQTDLLVAEATAAVANNATAPAAPETGSVVKFQFQHLLANVMIKIKSQIDGVIIKSVTLSGIDDHCTCNGSTWAISGNTTSIEYDTPTTLTKGDDYVDVTGGGILVIPASSSEKTLTIEANKLYNLTIPSGVWEMGNRYTYTVLIKQDDIIFVDGAPYVEEWDSENATGSVIIK